MNTDRWYYRVFQSAPDLIRALLPGLDGAAPALGLDVVLLEVQMHPDPGFHHRLAAQTYRFLQQQPQVEHWAVLVITPHSRLKLGPTQALHLFLEQQVVWLSLEELSQQPNLDPLLNLLTLPVRHESELQACSQQILARRPDLKTVVLTMLVQRFPELTEAQIMVIAGIPREEIRHTRAVQDWLAEGRQEGLQEGEARGEARGEAKMTLRLLSRRCGPLSDASTAWIQSLPVEKMEALADALLDFQGPADLAAWLAASS